MPGQLYFYSAVSDYFTDIPTQADRYGAGDIASLNTLRVAIHTQDLTSLNDKLLYTHILYLVLLVTSYWFIVECPVQK